jgi:hypothetical protein
MLQTDRLPQEQGDIMPSSDSSKPHHDVTIVFKIAGIDEGCLW